MTSISNNFVDKYARRLLIPWIVVFTVVTLFSLYRSHQTAEQAHIGLCAVKANIISRLQRQELLLKLNPHGYLGTSAQSLRLTITGEEETLHTLDVVRGCPAIDDHG